MIRYTIAAINEKKIKDSTKEIESMLDSMGASGRGLHEKLSSVEDKFTDDTVRAIRFIATIRNKVQHEYGYEIDSSTKKEFFRQHKRVMKVLKKDSSKFSIVKFIVIAIVLLVFIYMISA